MKMENSHDRLVARVSDTLAGLLNVGSEQVSSEVKSGSQRGGGPDLVIRSGGRTFVVEVKGSAAAGTVAMAVDRVRAHALSMGADAVPLVAVPYMGAVSRRLCEEAQIGWLDLSGNGVIVAPGLHVRVEGRPNQFRRAGRPADLFAPKSSRVVRWFLMHPGQGLAQRSLARATGVDEGHLSRLVARLEEQRYLVRDEAGALSVRDPNLLLDAWREAYSFDRHHLVKGHVPARSGETLLLELAKRLSKLGIQHAATGLGAAWLITRFAGFRTVTMYLDRRPSGPWMGELGWREGDRGANVWLVVPNDEGVFQGAVQREGIRCAHPVQV